MRPGATGPLARWSLPNGPADAGDGRASWTTMWGRGERRQIPDSAGEADAYRSGRYADYLVSCGAPVPPWAWMNALAHGGDVLVASLALAEGGPRGTAPALEPWYLVRKAIAEEVVVTLTIEGCTLGELQAGLLVGLELELAAVDPWVAVDPEGLTCLVLEELHAYRERSRR